MTRWILGVACLATAYAWADPATGWKQGGSGPYVYSDPVNWVDGEVNGVFGSDLTLSDDQTIVFGSDAEISGLDIAFSGSKTLTLASDGQARVLSLRDGVNVNVADAAKVVFGTVEDSLELDLGTEGVAFSVQRGSVELGARLSGGGGFKVKGGDLANSSMRILNGANAFSGVVEISGGNRACHVCFSEAGSLPKTGVTIRLSDGGVLRSCKAVGYSCGWYAASGVLDPASSGTLCVGENDDTDVDLSPYPYLAFGSSGGNYTFWGRLIVANGLYRIRTCGHHLYLSRQNVFTGSNDVLIEHQTAGESVYIPEANDVEGAITVHGGGFVLQGANGAVPNADIVLTDASQMFLQASGDKIGARSVTLRSSSMIVSGTSKSDVVHTIPGALRIDGTAGGCSVIRVTPNDACGVKLKAARLEMPMPAVLAVEGVGLGSPFGANAGNIVFDEAPTLVGGGGTAGTQTVSIVPRLIGSTVSGGTSPDKYAQSFVTYDAETGLRPLDLATEYASTIDAAVPMANVRVPFGTSLVIDSAKTVNALLFQGAGSGTAARYLVPAEEAEGAKVTVSSGQVIFGMQPKSACYLCSVPLDFGTAAGVLWHEIKNTQYFEAPLVGKDGVVYVQPQTTRSSEKATWLQGSVGGLSGPIWVLGNGMLGPNFLSSLVGRGEDVVVPSGARLLHNVATPVDGYRLCVDGSVTVSPITVKGGSTLAGSGSFLKPVTLKEGAKVEVGPTAAGIADRSMDLNGGLSVDGNTDLAIKVLPSGETGLMAIGGAVNVAEGAKLTVMATDRFKGERLVVKGSGLSAASFLHGAGCRGLVLKGDSELWMLPGLRGMTMIVR